MAAHESDMDEAANRLREAQEQREKMMRLKEVYEKDFAADPENISAPPPEPEKKRRGRPSTRLPMESTKATAVGRSAGG